MPITRPTKLISDKDSRKSMLNMLLKKRTVGKEIDYDTKEEKKLGTVSGYIGTRKVYDQQKENKEPRHMIKLANSKNNNSCDAMGIVHEIITGFIYERFLYKRSPIITPIKVNNNIYNDIGMTSEFLPGDFKTLSQYTDGEKECEIGDKSWKLTNVSGAEKLFAVMMTLGEYDIHPGNIGVMIENGVPVYAKIDHGWSATQFFTTPDAALENLAASIEIYRYDDKISLNITKLSDAIEQICYMDDEEIERIIQHRMIMLKQMDFKINELLIPEWSDDLYHNHRVNMPKFNNYNNFDELAEHLTTLFKQQLSVMRKVGRRLNVIANIDMPINEKDTWEKGLWLRCIGGEAPVTWATRYNYTISGKNPIDWMADEIIYNIEVVNERMFKLFENKLQTTFDKKNKETFVGEPIEIDSMIDGIVTDNDIEMVLEKILEKGKNRTCIKLAVLNFLNNNIKLKTGNLMEKINTKEMPEDKEAQITENNTNIFSHKL